ncbi:MAG TPA: flavin reductase family protein [Anaerovoracaceae bacterium]|nr:flavin reductase family protein [Anaerovoracaceae bacterium]
MKKELGAKPIVFPTPVLIIGTYNDDGTPNAMNVAWGGICGSEPPAVMIAVRKERKTYENLCRCGEFTVNIPNENLMEAADFFGIASGKTVDKFQAAGVKAVKGKHVNAPYIEEFPVNVECRLLDKLEIGLHVIFIGEILNVMADDAVLGDEGKIDVAKVGAIGFDPAARNYTATGKVVGKAFSAGLPILKSTENNK